jgi:hypothetical protein
MVGVDIPGLKKERIEPRVLQECYKECYESVSRVLQDCIRVLQECYKGVTGVFQGCYKSVTGVYKGVTERSGVDPRE